MQLKLIAIGRRMPTWVSQGFVDYAGRLRSGFSLELVEIDASRRTRNADIVRLVREEGERLLRAVPSGWRCIALDPASRWQGIESVR